MISTRFSPSRPGRAGDHETDQEDAEDDVPRRLRLREHDVLPDECREVEHRHEHGEPHPALQHREKERERDERDVRDGRNPVGRRGGHDDPVGHEVGHAATRAAAAVDPGVIDRSHDRVDDDPEREEPAEHRGEPPREAQRRDEADDDDGVEEHARVAGIAEHLEQDADQHRADARPRPGCRRRRGSPSCRS